jgi:hypothetical protein
VEISEVTRRNIFDQLHLDQIAWRGRLDEREFLSRLFDLKSMPSNDGRFRNAWGDVGQHRIRNLDWDDDWVFYDTRFNLLRCSDETLLRFLCEMLHPVVRPEADDVARLQALINGHLMADGWELFERTAVSGKPVFAARPLLPDAHIALESAQVVATTLNAAYVTQQVTRLEAAVHGDPELAIGTAKEFVETVCKTILTQRGVPFDKSLDFPQLVRLTLTELSLVADGVDGASRAAATVRRLLQNLATIANGLAELRNPYGTGHGKPAHTEGLQSRHARLAVGAAATLAVFLFETHEQGPSGPSV